MTDHPLTQIQHLLPASVQALLTVISANGVVSLIRHRGGTRLPVPKTPAEDSPIRAWLNDDDVAKLCSYYGGDTLELPRCLEATLAARNLLILADKRTGLTLTQLALKYQLTERGITKALRRTEPNELQQWAKPNAPWRQADLFT
jgi:hypothetical protein